MDSKNQKLIESFSAYCKKYPEQRFWQALRNWAGVYAIYIKELGHGDDEVDTFYSNSQDGLPDA